MKVLLVENKDICIDVLMAILSGSSKQVEACGTVAEAAEKLKTYSADVVVIDKEIASSPDIYTHLASVPIVIVTSDDYMGRARRWTQTVEGGLLQEALEKSAERKDTMDRIERILVGMKQRNDEALREIEQIPAEFTRRGDEALREIGG